MAVIYIDALAIVPKRMSGIGHTTLGIIRELARRSEAKPELELCLVVPLGKRKQLQRYGFNSRVKIMTIPLPAKVFELLLRLRVMPPLDLFLGRGSYLFPNYRNWPLLSSSSYTFIHDAVFVAHPDFVQPKNLAYLQRYVGRWIKRATVILTLSTFSERELITKLGISADRIAVVPCGVDLTVFYPQQPAVIREVRKKYQLPKKYFIYVGNIEPRKNLVRLVQAFDQLPIQNKRTVSLVMVGGSSWLSKEIEDAINKARHNGSDIVCPADYVCDEDLPAAIGGSLGLVHPALYEGFGIAPLQAMACGVPVITSNTSSLPEVVGPAALLVNPLDTRSIALAMQRLIKEPELRSRLEQAGLRQCRNFTWQRSVDRLLEVIEHVSAERPAARKVTQYNTVHNKDGA